MSLLVARAPRPHLRRAALVFERIVRHACASPENHASAHVKSDGRYLRGSEQASRPTSWELARYELATACPLSPTWRDPASKRKPAELPVATAAAGQKFITARLGLSPLRSP